MSNLKELRAKRHSLREEIQTLCDKPSITAGEDQRLTRQLAALEKVEAEIEIVKHELDASIVERAPGFDSPTVWKQTSKREVFTADSHDSRTKADYARRAVDVLQEGTGREVRSDVVQHFERTPIFADLFRATANPDYASAFAKMLAHGESGALLRLSDGERSALERVAAIEGRSMSLTDANGGWLVPGAVDPQIMANGTGAVSSLRDVARVVTAVSDTWRGIASTGITASFVPELTEIGDNSPTLTSALITAHKAASFVPVSFELQEDAPTLIAQLRQMLADAKAELEASKFLYGSGANEPYGILTRLEANTNADVIVTTSGTIGAVDVYNLAATLPPRFRPNATWHAEMSVLNSIRKISDDKLGNYVTDLRSGYNFQLLGRPVYEASDMDPMVNTTAAATFLLFGDINRAYTIFDRLGSGRVSFVNHLMGTTNNRPIGASGVYYHWRVGADVLQGSTTGENGARILVNKVS